MGDAQSKQDRELMGLLHGLRVALAGVHVLIALLLAVASSPRFPGDRAGATSTLPASGLHHAAIAGLPLLLAAGVVGACGRWVR